MSDLRSRLSKLRPEPVVKPAQLQEPDMAQRIARLRPGAARRPSAEQCIQELQRAVGGDVVAPGLMRIERRYSLSHCHGRFALGQACKEGAVYFDTETTGLAGGTGTVAFVIGAARYEEDTFVATQWLLTQLGGEATMLRLFSEYLSSGDTLVSFNGKTFDVPLLSTRFRLAGMRDPLQGRNHEDLIHPTRRAFKRQWFDCRLATAENLLLGVVREADLPGAMAPYAFTQWLRFGEGELLSQVLHHNLLDVLSLATLSHALEEVYRAPVQCGADVVALARHALANSDEQTALDCLLDAGSDLLPQGQLVLARLFKRRGQWNEALILWQALAENGYVEALEELAKHAEHRLKDAELALQWAQKLVEQMPNEPLHQHRRARLLAKVSEHKTS